jgi:hypothetical protein
MKRDLTWVFSPKVAFTAYAFAAICFAASCSVNWSESRHLGFGFFPLLLFVFLALSEGRNLTKLRNTRTEEL